MPNKVMLSCAALVAAFALESHAAVELQTAVRNGASKPQHSVIVLRAVDVKEGTEPEQRRIDVSAGPVTIDVAPDTRWALSVDAPGFWSPPGLLTIPPAGENKSVTVPLWQTTTLRGRLRLPEKEPLPQSVSVAIESPPLPAKRPEIARGTHVDCDVAADGAWSCAVPATPLDLAIRVKGYAPVYRWGAALAPEKALDLGDVRLQKGASLLAFLDADTAKLLSEPARATITRMVSTDPSQTGERLAAPVADVAFNERGVAQIVSLPVGTFVLTVAAKGFAPARVFPIEVYEANETVLRKPVELERPITLRLALHPPKDPNGNPWQAEFHRVATFSSGHDPEPAFRGPVDERGEVQVPNQAPGSFQVTVSDRAGSVFARRDFNFNDAATATASIDVPVVPVHGKVLLGDTPLPADLWFGGRNGSVRVFMRTNDEGAFEGSLPNDGDWTVQVTGRVPKLQTVTHVAVGDDEVMLRIPDTTVRGIVVDPDGLPRDKVEITANAAGRSVVIRAYQDGTFVFRGLPETAVDLQAADIRTGRRSRSLQVAVKSGALDPPIELRLEPDRALKGHVVSRGAPVIGARVAAQPFVGASSQPQVRVVSNEEGAFEVEIPEAAQHAWIVIGAPGKTLQNYDVPLNGNALTLDLEPVGGTLLLSWPKGNLPNVARAGIPLMLTDLTAWARSQGQALAGEQLRVSNLAPGPYRACTMAPVQTSPDAPPQPRCTDGVLAPGGTLTLDLGS
ncbi:MAG TPA: carboxypeptidase-like regulatory domain-containing protein [Thermoanaerobaculia bacterium]|nr:carboxypeptidase-like regulatory domain-containing protein [Thermoanaerobaculia bacterium]